jgi:hypothetical protein
MKYEDLRGTTGFYISWAVLVLFSFVMTFYDTKLGVMGLIISFVFGFLGFDMVDSLCKKHKAGVRKR